MQDSAALVPFVLWLGLTIVVSGCATTHRNGASGPVLQPLPTPAEEAMQHAVKTASERPRPDVVIRNQSPARPAVAPAVAYESPGPGNHSIQPAQFTNPAQYQGGTNVWNNYGQSGPPAYSSPAGGGALGAPGIVTGPPAVDPYASGSAGSTGFGGGGYGPRIPGTGVVPQYSSTPVPGVPANNAAPYQIPGPPAPTSSVVPQQFGGSVLPPPPSYGPPVSSSPGFIPETYPPGGSAFGQPSGGLIPDPAGIMGIPTNFADVIVNVSETQTGRFMLGAAVNSDAGVTGQIVIDERNFDWRRVPTSFDDFVNGGAFRGAGQGFRLEMLPGSVVQRYMLQFTEPYLFNTRVSMNASGYLFDRRYFDWDEERLGGRLGFGYRITPDLSLSFGVRGEQVTISNPRLSGVAPELDAVLADDGEPNGNASHDLYSGRITLTQDTRDIPFAPTQGYYFEASFEQVFGNFDYSRGEIDYRRYFLVTERPDRSGRHVLGFSNRLSISGSQTPIFENYFAGGYSTIRGFDFRRASPQDGTVTVGGRLMFLGSVEYLFPITADDMLKGVAFVDYGTVEEDIEINAEDYRVAVGLGLRISVPAMGPAPIALDFAIPLAREDTDEIRNFSFFVGLSR